MTITQWTREREQKIAAANREARKAYVDKLYNSGWQDGSRPRSYPGDKDGGMFDFVAMTALVAAGTLFILGMRWLLF